MGLQPDKPILSENIINRNALTIPNLPNTTASLKCAQNTVTKATQRWQHSAPQQVAALGLGPTHCPAPPPGRVYRTLSRVRGKINIQGQCPPNAIALAPP